MTLDSRVKTLGQKCSNVCTCEYGGIAEAELWYHATSAEVATAKGNRNEQPLKAMFLC